MAEVAVVEIGTGLALMIAPAIIVTLLLGTEGRRRCGEVAGTRLSCGRVEQDRRGNSSARDLGPQHAPSQRRVAHKSADGNLEGLYSNTVHQRATTFALIQDAFSWKPPQAAAPVCHLRLSEPDIEVFGGAD
jgi:hypothetical protein